MSRTMHQPILALVALACLAAAAVWGRSARYRQRVLRRVERDSDDGDLQAITRSDYRKDVLSTSVYLVLAFICGVASVTSGADTQMLLVLVAVPAAVSLVLGRNFIKEARMEHGRTELERRAQEVLVQDELAPKRWAERLAPDDLPEIDGFELGRVYQAGSGLMAGDFYDIVHLGRGRIAAVIGDVSGHGIDPAITAFQAKYLLRVFLRQYRDPAQALEELNTQMAAIGRSEEFISLCVVQFDTQAGTLRFASAGHPAVWLWHRARGQPAAGHGSVAHARSEGQLLQPGDPARRQRPVPAVHRRAGRGPRRRPALRRGAHRLAPAT